MRQAVSVSLGSSQNDYSVAMELGGERVGLRRMGTDGDVRRMAGLLRQLDGQVEAIGLGGINLCFFCGRKPYPFHQGQELAGLAPDTPVVDGSTLKEWVEPETIPFLARNWGLDFQGRTALLASALDRYPLAAAMKAHGARLIVGDAMFALGLPVPFHSLAAFNLVAGLTLPFFSHFPIGSLYPLGERQLEIRPRWCRYYRQADILAGDWHFLRRHLPQRLDGKIVITSTVTASDRDSLSARGAKTLVTFMPAIGGRSLAANAWEAAFTAAAGRRLQGRELLEAVWSAGLEPEVTVF
ncbi:MAG: quinate 5-dehydrogenase [Clostridia bacterium]|nr:MAG: quinate 5-dehydrogenase [Clostridia bacterium]